jgi:hypothetical protein
MLTVYQNSRISLSNGANWVLKPIHAPFYQTRPAFHWGKLEKTE